MKPRTLHTSSIWRRFVAEQPSSYRLCSEAEQPGHGRQEVVGPDALQLQARAHLRAVHEHDALRRAGSLATDRQPGDLHFLAARLFSQFLRGADVT